MKIFSRILLYLTVCSTVLEMNKEWIDSYNALDETVKQHLNLTKSVENAFMLLTSIHTTVASIKETSVNFYHDLFLYLVELNTFYHNAICLDF